MKKRVGYTVALLLIFSMASESVFAQWETVWQLGAPGRAWPVDGVGGGVEVDFIQEAGVNDPPGDPDSPSVAQQADDDYYVGGEYPDPIGVVPDEKAMERAFAGTDNDLRIHFNLSEDLSPASEIRFLLESNNLDDRAENADPRYGVEVFFNGVLIAPERIVRAAELNTIFTSDPISLGEVGAVFGPGGDNVVLVHGINYNDDGGGNWMGMDYHHLEVNQDPAVEVPTLSEWGMILVALVLLAGGATCLRRRRQPAC